MPQFETIIENAKVLRVRSKLLKKIPDASNFEKVYLNDISLSKPLSFGIYLPVRTREEDVPIKFVKIAEKGDFLSPKWKQFLKETTINIVYVHISEIENFLDNLLYNTAELLDNPHVSVMKKISIAYRNAHYVIRAVMFNPKSGNNIERVRQFVDSYALFIIKNKISASMLCRLFAKDYSLFAHSVQVGLLSIAFASITGIISVAYLIDLGIGALLHDVGKIELPSELLSKPGPLSQEEFKIISKHPEIGFQLLKIHDFLNQDSLDIVLQHHERSDGKGYPAGLTDEEINPLAKLVHIVDCYDALTMQRSYRDALSPFEALTVMTTDMKESFDEELIKDFIRFLGY
ncbi:MAG: HD domain-containing protein [Deltaproteobacteria bacterium]|nr:HD domain-containing protein [Deltaproteobacteria bacterium]